MKIATMNVDRPSKILPKESTQPPKRKRKISIAHVVQICSFVAIVVIFLIYKVDWDEKNNYNRYKKSIKIEEMKLDPTPRWRGGKAVANC